LLARIADDAKDGAGHIANMAKPSDKVSRGAGRNPSDWRDFCPMALPLALPMFAI
jgi:hypothetical protein